MQSVDISPDYLLGSHNWTHNGVFCEMDANGNIFQKTLLFDNSDVLTIENLRQYNNSCSSCGVSWYDGHVTLDCDECGGYALVKPCPKCDGQCDSIWNRDSRESHLRKKAVFKGQCLLSKSMSSITSTMTMPDSGRSKPS